VYLLADTLLVIAKRVSIPAIETSLSAWIDLTALALTANAEVQIDENQGSKRSDLEHILFIGNLGE